MRRIGPSAPAIVLGADDEDARVLLGALIGEHHAATGHGPEARTMVPACETCGLLLEAMWSLDAESVAS
jgi:hypothetical protein